MKQWKDSAPTSSEEIRVNGTKQQPKIYQKVSEVIIQSKAERKRTQQVLKNMKGDQTLTYPGKNVILMIYQFIQQIIL